MKIFFIPPWRNTAMSSMLSAPATMPATSAATFNPALAPLSVGTLNHSSASSCRPASWARRITGTNPDGDTRFASSKETDTAAGVWETRSGSPSPLLGPGPLRTGHATFTASGSSKSLWASFLLVLPSLFGFPSLTAGVDEVVHGLIAVSD